ncbi:MAG TPA: SGNH/GDSL hydrolase family protein [Pirellulales bacterium]|jgi:lysophospholipase L1-like esterase
MILHCLRRLGRRPLALALAIGFAQLLSNPDNAAANPLRLGILGDSISAGDGSAVGSYPNWVTQLTASGAFTVGPDGNQAGDGDVASDVFNTQLPVIQGQIQSGQLDYTVLAVGANDLGNAALTYVATGDLAGTLQLFFNTVLPTIENTITTIAATSPPVHQIVMNIPDPTSSPEVQGLIAQYGITPAQLAPAIAALQTANDQLDAFALARGIPVIDLYTATQTILTHPPLVLAGVTYNDLFAPDAFHPGPALQGLIADAVINAANRAYGAGLAPISEEQIVANLGGTPLIAGPTYYNLDHLVLLPVPEPSTMVLAVLGAMAWFALPAIARRRSPQSSGRGATGTPRPRTC